MHIKEAKQRLLSWFKENQRALPWRESRDPYRIWISETMLQQTTTTAVIPYFERFIKIFPNLKSLAQSPVEEVVAAWAGLGYYSRARNLHKSAQALYANGGFPTTYEKLSELPGFGPYTSRAVASLAFDQSVGVVDGNVIRVFARLYSRDWLWWQTRARLEIQALADEWVEDCPPYQMNQALMELGRTICTPKSPSCLLCPARAFCKALREDTISLHPRPRPRRDREIWLLEFTLKTKGSAILLARSAEIPFLRNQWSLPAVAKKVTKKPTQYDYKHSITHHDIFVTIRTQTPKVKMRDTKWVPQKEIQRHAPASLVKKALDLYGDPQRRTLRQRKKTSPARNSNKRS